MQSKLGLMLCILSALGKSVYAEDSCNWRGSGLISDFRPRALELVRLRCVDGSLEWIFPKRALRVILEPNLGNGKYSTACIKPSASFQGASMYVERNKELHLLGSETQGLQQVHCFSMDRVQRVTLFLQASLQSETGTRTVGFQYELLSNQKSWPGFQNIALLHGVCRPCDNKELLMAVCNSDFVVRGSIRDVSHDAGSRTSRVDVTAHKVYRQRNNVFQLEDSTGSWAGPIRTLLQCRVSKGAGEFLFTGSEHFGDAWLGCAPRLKDFHQIYKEALDHRTNPCELQID
uniref:Meteorin-like protein n=1 Tax=Leptobrachium leishanense TaxID=445787 RepID=A0A8C5QZ46_9ANUR